MPQTATPIATPLGPMMLVAEDGIPVRLTDEMDLPISPPSAAAQRLLEGLRAHFADPTAKARVIVSSQIEQLLSGRVSDFQLKVLGAINDIPAGQTRTYGQIAQSIHNPGAVRAVGSACARNPLPLVIPCHRVVPAHGLGKYSGPGGIASKQLLLQREGAI